ncbi:SRPBCC family protein [Streptomyces phaeochromogenes]|uniref:SRPBCC domain-containing protein n=1 Tax=Streptomyces phaeochromogenes TaxID=1923 RepID=A0ABZ1HPD0_STRPH|nr:SRPBCC domain-containing protein [Streptomyces phaeochromogenes]WSD20457.1 SRPBCC domain-containing protein [Streptomyces phaeochromogenes]WSJ02851.1 SRPBCC domain-containing protein [Streptomyces phaeochromogenes]
MDFTNEFRVNLPPDQAWSLLTDVERIAPCMPGAQLTGVDGDTYNGVVKVKVGPMTVQYKGVVSFEEKDDEARTAVLHARGRDTRGQGNADARVTARLVPDGDGTRVTVETHLTITGRIAQFGRGVIEEVSGKLLAQFVDNLEGQLATEKEQAEDRAQGQVQESVAPTSEAVAGAGAEPEPEAGAGIASSATPESASAGGATVDNAPGAEAPRKAAPSAPSAPTSSTAPTSPAAPATPASNGVRPVGAPAVSRTQAPAEPEPLDLMSVARGAVLKRALPAAIVLAVVVVVLVVWLTR